MALELKLKHVGTSPKGDIVYLTDDTGVYDSVENPGGWGVPNPERASAVLGVFGLLHKTKGDQDVPIEPTVPTEAVEDIEDWNALPGSDGYHEFFEIAVENGSSVQLGRYCYFDNVLDQDHDYPAVYKVMSVGNVEQRYVADSLDYLTAKAIYDDVVNGVPFFGEEDEPQGVIIAHSEGLKVPVLSRISIYRNNLNLELVKMYRQQTDDRGHIREIRDMEDNYNYARSMTEGAKYQWAMGNYNETQIIVESFEEVLKDEWKQNY